MSDMDKVRELTREQIEQVRDYYVGDPTATLTGWQVQVNAVCEAALRGLENPKGGQEPHSASVRSDAEADDGNRPVQSERGSLRRATPSTPASPAGPEEVREACAKVVEESSPLVGKWTIAEAIRALPLAPLAAEWVKKKHE